MLTKILFYFIYLHICDTQLQKHHVVKSSHMSYLIKKKRTLVLLICLLTYPPLAIPNIAFTLIAGFMVALMS